MHNQWTREQIIRHLLDREAKGQRLALGRDGVDTLMYQAARRIFGSWRNAVQAAGIKPNRILRLERWTPDKILVTIRQLGRYRQPLSAARMGRRYSKLISAARRHFGSWTKAILAAGVDPMRFRRVIPWNQERVIEAILTRALRNESLVARLVVPRSLVSASYRFFGGWTAAVAAAGLDPKTTALPPRRLKRLPILKERPTIENIRCQKG